VAENKISMEQYLEQMARFTDDRYGQMVRRQFRDMHGSSELGMLAAPSGEELQQLRRAVAIMTPAEKQHPERLTDEQIQSIAADAQVDPANLAIFINGYVLYCKRVS